MNPSTDPAEPDLYWAGPSGWAMIPGALLGGVLSAVLMFGGPPVAARIGMDADWGTFLWFWVAIAGWAAAGLVWAYRGACFVYRLTPRHLYTDFGPLYRPMAPVELRAVTAVECPVGPLRRLLNVGPVVVRVGDRPLRLPGVFRPDAFAQAIRDAGRRARGE